MKSLSEVFLSQEEPHHSDDAATLQLINKIKSYIYAQHYKYKDNL